MFTKTQNKKKSNKIIGRRLIAHRNIKNIFYWFIDFTIISRNKIKFSEIDFPSAFSDKLCNIERKEFHSDMNSIMQNLQLQIFGFILECFSSNLISAFFLIRFSISFSFFSRFRTASNFQHKFYIIRKRSTEDCLRKVAQTHSGWMEKVPAEWAICLPPQEN